MTKFKTTRYEIFTDDTPVGPRFPTFGDAFVEIRRIVRDYRNEGRHVFDNKKGGFTVEGVGFVHVRKTGSVMEIYNGL